MVNNNNTCLLFFTSTCAGRLILNYFRPVVALTKHFDHQWSSWIINLTRYYELYGNWSTFYLHVFLWSEVEYILHVYLIHLFVLSNRVQITIEKTDIDIPSFLINSDSILGHLRSLKLLIYNYLVTFDLF